MPPRKRTQKSPAKKARKTRTKKAKAPHMPPEDQASVADGADGDGVHTLLLLLLFIPNLLVLLRQMPPPLAEADAGGSQP